MKKTIFTSILALTLLVGGCSSKVETTQSNPNDDSSDKPLQIGITQFAEHPALDAVREGFTEELLKEGIQANIEYRNAQTDMSMNTTIAEKFAQEKKDLVLAITTVSAQGAKNAIHDIPVLFSAVTDPLAAELVQSMDRPSTNLSGTTDAAPVEKQLHLFQEMDPNIKNIGIIYNTGETNSSVQIEQAKSAADQLGLSIVSIGITNVNEIPQAVDSILDKVDGIYTITDNVVASSIHVVASKAIAKGIPTVGAERAHVEGGILMTDGINYKELGKQTAQMAKRLLINKADIASMPVESLEKTEKVVNLKTLHELKLDENLSVFTDCEKFQP